MLVVAFKLGRMVCVPCVIGRAILFGGVALLGVGAGSLITASGLWKGYVGGVLLSWLCAFARAWCVTVDGGLGLAVLGIAWGLGSMGSGWLGFGLFGMSVHIFVFMYVWFVLDGLWFGLVGVWAFCSFGRVMIGLAVRLNDGAHVGCCMLFEEPESLILAQSERWRHA